MHLLLLYYAANTISFGVTKRSKLGCKDGFKGMWSYRFSTLEKIHELFPKF